MKHNGKGSSIALSQAEQRWRHWYDESMAKDPSGMGGLSTRGAREMMCFGFQQSIVLKIALRELERLRSGRPEAENASQGTLMHVDQLVASEVLRLRLANAVDPKMLE